MTARTLLDTYRYEDERGRVLLLKRRYEPKAFAMQARKRETCVWVNPSVLEDKYPTAAAYFASLLFNLPLLVAGPRHIAWTEGEKDAKALTAAGLPAVSHWQGAGSGPAPEQFARFASFRGRVTVVADLDAAGALDALRRCRGLREIGMAEGRIRVVRARSGKDAHDHLAAGHDLCDFVRVDMARLRALAATAPPPTKGGSGYDASAWAPGSVLDFNPTAAGRRVL
jgi:hypothetical protein